MKVCELCNASFDFDCQYDRHISNRKACVSTKKVLEILEENKQLKNKIHYTNISNSTINSHNIIHNYNSIVININPFTKENIDYISDQDIINLKDFTSIMMEIWCNDKKIENNNIKLRSRETVPEVWDGKKWVPRVWEKCFRDMKDKVYDMLDERFDKNKSKELKRVYHKFLDDIYGYNWDVDDQDQNQDHDINLEDKPIKNHPNSKEMKIAIKNFTKNRN